MASWPVRCGACCSAMTTTLPRESRHVITTTRRPGRNWSMRWASDAHAPLAALDGRELDPALAQAAALLTARTGQDLEESAGGVFWIAQGRRGPGDLHLGSRYSGSLATAGLGRARQLRRRVDPRDRHGQRLQPAGFDGGAAGSGPPTCQPIAAVAATRHVRG